MFSASSILPRALRAHAHERNLALALVSFFQSPLQGSACSPSFSTSSTLSQLQYRGLSSSPGAHASSQHARVLDGRKASSAWIDELSLEVQEVTKVLQRPPGLAVVLVGRRADSLLYVTRKQEAAHRAGIAVHIYPLPEQVSQEGVEAAVRAACHHPEVDGVLIQLPLPRHLSEEAVMEHLDPHKDVDGFHPLNMGRILMRGRTPYLVPCTPLGCMQLLRRSNISVKGKSAVVVGDSNIVGTPLAAMLRDEGAAAVTICHRISYSDWFASYEATLLQQQDRARAAAAACLPQLPGPRPVEARPAAAPEDPPHTPPDALHPSLQVTTASPLASHSVGETPGALPMQSHVLTPPASPTIYPPGSHHQQSSGPHSEPLSKAHGSQQSSATNSSSSQGDSSDGSLHGWGAPTSRPSSFQDGDPPEFQALHAATAQQHHQQHHQQQPAHPHSHTQPESIPLVGHPHPQHCHPSPAAPSAPPSTNTFTSTRPSPDGHTHIPPHSPPDQQRSPPQSQPQQHSSSSSGSPSQSTTSRESSASSQPHASRSIPASRRPPSPETSLSGQLPGICRAADLLVVACGCPELVRADWVKRGAVVLDVGINVMPVSSTSTSPSSNPAASSSSGGSGSSQASQGSLPNSAHRSSVLASGTFQVVGDVHFPEVSKVASAVSPVPGGLGPMTIAALLHNTVRAARLTAVAAKSSEARAAEQHAAKLTQEAKDLQF